MKPEIVADVRLSSVSRDARLTFIYMITQADDFGLLAGAPRQLVGTLYPLDESVTAPMLLDWIGEMVTVGLIRRRATRDGVPVLQITNWSKHQRIDNAGRSQLGALLAESPDDPPPFPANLGKPPRAAEVSGLDHRPPIEDLGSPTLDQGPPTVQEVAAATIRLAVMANKGLDEHPTKRQAIPRIIATSGRTHAAAEEILLAGVPLEFAESAVYELARTNSADGEVKTLGYFTAAAIRRWRESQEGLRATTAARPDPLRAPPNGRGKAPESVGDKSYADADAAFAAYNAGKLP